MGATNENCGVENADEKLIKSFRKDEKLIGGEIGGKIENANFVGVFFLQFIETERFIECKSFF